MKITFNSEPPRPTLSEMDAPSLDSWVAGLGLPRYRGKQIWAALNQRAAQDFSQVTELPLELRRRLATDARARSLQARTRLVSPSDRSEKVLFELKDGATIETVLIRGKNAGGRLRQTVCVSSQVGCPAGCTFCATGLSGFARNLTVGEIVDQVMYFAAALGERGERVTNVVFMGMGEPLLNALSVRKAIERLVDPNGFNLGERRLTLSTVGIVPQIYKFAEWGGQVNLAVSLHAPNDVLRSQLVPYNGRFPIGDLMEAVTAYTEKTHRRVSFEYVLLRDVNDSPALAVELADLIRPFGGMAHVNLIPWNPFREGKFVRSEGPDADEFAAVLTRAGVNATIRYSRGLDISAACGQLREQVEAGA